VTPRAKSKPEKSKKMTNKVEFTKDEMIEKDKGKTKRYPNLLTVLMVEDFLKNQRDIPMKVSEIKDKLPRQVMHQTLLIVLEYLWKSGKIIYGPRGVQWIFSSPEHIKKMLKDSIEI